MWISCFPPTCSFLHFPAACKIKEPAPCVIGDLFFNTQKQWYQDSWNGLAFQYWASQRLFYESFWMIKDNTESADHPLAWYHKRALRLWAQGLTTLQLCARLWLNPWAIWQKTLVS